MRWFLTFALCLTFATPAHAQPRLGGLRGGFGGAGGGGALAGGLAGGVGSPGTFIHFLLLEQPSVQQELRTTPQQQQQAQQLFETQRQKLQQLSGLPREQAVQQAAELRSSADKQLQAILTADQFRRLREIGLQKIGPIAIARPDVAEAVQLTPEQTQQIRALEEQLIQAGLQTVQSLRPAGGGRPRLRELRTKMATLNDSMARIQAMKKDTEAKIVALLTTEQKARWTQMQGVPFQGQVNLGPLGNQLLSP